MYFAECLLYVCARGACQVNFADCPLDAYGPYLNACWVFLHGVPVGRILLNTCSVRLQRAPMGCVLLHAC